MVEMPIFQLITRHLQLDFIDAEKAKHQGKPTLITSNLTQVIEYFFTQQSSKRSRVLTAQANIDIRAQFKEEVMRFLEDLS